MEEFPAILCKAPYMVSQDSCLHFSQDIHLERPRFMREDNSSPTLQTLGGIAFSIREKWSQLSARQ